MLLFYHILNCPKQDKDKKVCERECEAQLCLVVKDFLSEMKIANYLA